ncbi:protein of unknown function [Candidatus Methylomirabilis oxygeniifera]|uniref:Uncharacterized protein n=1 Tax=Methylomirabilis oxygeniifera TaxID=671143 RepID=D5MLR7_METO1|nr:protein of unknown function [Candidatus Methylomirabilis oxyfera]
MRHNTLIVQGVIEFGKQFPVGASPFSLSDRKQCQDLFHLSFHLSKIVPIGVGNFHVQRTENGDDQRCHGGLEEKEGADLEIGEGGVRKPDQPARGLVGNRGHEGQVYQPDLGQRPEGHEQHEVAQRQDEDAHRQEMEMTDFEQDLITARRHELRLGPPVVSDDGLVIKPHLIKEEQCVGEPQARAVKEKPQNDGAKQPVLGPLSGDDETHYRSPFAIST